MAVKGRCKACGICLQILVCTFNGLAFIIGFALFAYGLAIGLHTQTISPYEDTSYKDLLISTPATVFFHYGLFLLIITLTGCFAAISGNCVCLFIYLVLIGLFGGVDFLFGVSFSFPLDSYTKYLKGMKESEKYFADENSDNPLFDWLPHFHFGMIPLLTEEEYWNHFQRRGKCCGVYTYKEWREVNYGKKKNSLPDGCCTKFFEGCGGNFFDSNEEHDGGEWQPITLNATTKAHPIGCLSIFPSFMQNDTHQIIDWSGKGILGLLVICFFFAKTLMCCVCSRAHRPSLGLTNPDFIDAPISPICKRNFRKVAPESTASGTFDW